MKNARSGASAPRQSSSAPALADGSAPGGSVAVARTGTRNAVRAVSAVVGMMNTLPPLLLPSARPFVILLASTSVATTRLLPLGQGPSIGPI